MRLLKIILSRKGFDSGYGGYPSPIMPNGELISMPIPSASDNINYCDLKYDGKTYSGMMRDLYKGYIKNGGCKVEISDGLSCHLDPDINKTVYERKDGWRPMFGQISGSQTHLENKCVGIGDIFLFFGWFRKTIEKDGKILFDPKDKKGKHIIFGYLEVHEIKRIDNNTELAEWMKYHPHACTERRKLKSNNTIYIAKDKLTLNSNIDGAGVFIYDEGLVLTKEGYSVSRWDLPDFFKELDISYHSKECFKENYFQSVAKGQEFVIDANGHAIEWAKSIIEAGNVRKLAM